MNLKFVKKIIIIIFCICIIVSTIFFIKQVTMYKFDVKINIVYFVYFIILYLISHFFRLLRLFTIYIEEKISLKKLFETYIVVNYVNFFTPYKVGELFRIFEISYVMKSFRKGFTGVWIDRFFDTVILFLFLIFNNSPYEGIKKILLFFFVGFILFSLFCYVFSAYTITYINGIMLSKSKTKKGLYILKIVDYIEDTQKTAKYLLKGKEFILFLISSFVWMIEIYSFKVLSKIFESGLDIKYNFNLIIFNWLKNTEIVNFDIYILSLVTFIFSIIFIFKYSKNRIYVYMKGDK